MANGAEFDPTSAEREALKKASTNDRVEKEALGDLVSLTKGDTNSVDSEAKRIAELAPKAGEGAARVVGNDDCKACGMDLKETMKSASMIVPDGSEATEKAIKAAMARLKALSERISNIEFDPGKIKEA